MVVVKIKLRLTLAQEANLLASKGRVAQKDYRILSLSNNRFEKRAILPVPMQKLRRKIRSLVWKNATATTIAPEGCCLTLLSPGGEEWELKGNNHKK